MAKDTKYGIQSLKYDFPTDEECLTYIFDQLHTRKCSCGGTYALIRNRRQFQCSKCRFQIAPTANTIFHKSPTPLTLWFHAIHVFSNAKSGISAKQMERDLEVTYKTAWRILMLIRKALKQDNDKLRGTVEMDSAYMGGRKKAGRDNENLGEVMASKSVLTVAVERRGRIRAFIGPNVGAETLEKFVTNNIEEGSNLLTDQARTYARLAGRYNVGSVNHSKGEYVRGVVHINTTETWFSHIKNSIRGTHKVISKEYLQNYLDGFVFHYNNRRNDRERFVLLLETLLHASV